MKLVVMGVSGAGKSTLAAALADRLGSIYLDADDLHPPQNVARMAAGKPLTDDMREPWLEACASALQRRPSAVLACSALKRGYRNILRSAVQDITFIYPKITFEEAKNRMATRGDHFMPVSLLESQFQTLESPIGLEDDVITVVATQSVSVQVNHIVTRLTDAPALRRPARTSDTPE